MRRGFKKKKNWKGMVEWMSEFLVLYCFRFCILKLVVCRVCGGWVFLIASRKNVIKA